MTLLVKDTFTGVDGTALTAHTPDSGGGTWLVVEQGATCAAPSIKSNALKIDGGSSSLNETSSALPKSGGYGTSDYLVTATVSYVTNDTEEQFITARVDTAVGAYAKYSFGWYRNGQWQLRKYSGLNQQWSALSSATAAFPTGDQTLVMRVVTIGGAAAIQCKVNGAVVLTTYTDSSSPFTTGIAGVTGFNQSNNYAPTGIFVKDIQADTIPAGAQDVLVSVAPAGAIPATAFGTQPSGTIADAYGAAVTGQADTITIAKVSGPGALSGTLTATVNTGTGGWTFANVQASLAGDYVVAFTSANGYATATASFTVYAKTANFSASLLGHATIDAGMTPLDGAILEIRNGVQPASTAVAVTGTLGARITFEAIGTYNWGTPYGVTVVIPTASVVASASLTPTWARLFASNGTTVLMDVAAGSGAVLDGPAMTAGQRVQLEALVLRDPGYTISLATQVSGEFAVGGIMDGPAEEPRVYVDTTPPVTTVTKTVGRSGRDYSDLQVAVTAAAASGQSWLLQVDNGYDYTPPGGGGLLLPAKTGTNWVVISAATMPCAAGVRVTPASAASANIPKIRLDNNSTAITTTSGSTYYRLQGLEVLPIALGGIGEPYTLVNVQPDNNTFAGQGNSYADMPHHIVIDRCYIHGASNVNVKNGVPLHGDHVALIESYVSEIHADDVETHGATFYMQKGPVRITNNYIEGAGQSIIIGGSESVWPNVCVADIEIRYNTLAKDPAWNGVWQDIKTIMEMKAGRRCLIEGNEVKYNWNTVSAGWKGATFTFKTVSQNGSATVGHWRCSDVIMRNNRITYAGIGFNLHPLAEPSKPATPAARFTYRNNLCAHLADYPATDVTKWALFFGQISRVSVADLLVDHCTFVYPSKGATAIYLGDYGNIVSGGGVPALGFVRTTIKNSIFATGGDFPVYGRDYLYTDGALAYYLGPSSTLTRNVFSGGTTDVSGPPIASPATLNRWLTNTSNGLYPELGFNNLGTEDYSLVPGSTYSASGTFAALDATDLGVNMTTLLAALGGQPAVSATQLVVTTQPSALTASGAAQATQPVVQVRDGSGSVVATDTSTVTAFLVVESGSALPFGMLSVSAVVGVATFSGIGATSATGATAHWLFLDGALTPATSVSFTIAPAVIPSPDFGVPVGVQHPYRLRSHRWY